MDSFPPKCLLLISGAYHLDGGIASVNRLVIQAILEKGYSLDIYSLLEKDATISTRFLPAGAKVQSRAFAGNKILFTLAAWGAVLRHSYTLICVDHINIAAILAPLAWAHLCRYTVWLHSLELFPPRPDWEGLLGLRGASKRLANSVFTRQCVQRRFPALSVDVCELSLGPMRDANIFQQSALNFSAPPVVLQAVDASHCELGDQVILHVGRMISGERYKGQESLIRAFPMVLRQHPDVQLVLAGQGEDMPQLKGITQTLSPEVQKRIFFPGFVPDDVLEKIYRKCYVFAMPSIGEGFGLVYLEAMVHAKACLGGRVDATPFVVRDGLTGLLVDDPKSPDQVAAALNWFLAHPEENRRMGLAGYDLVNSCYLFPHFHKRFWNAIES